MDVINECGPKGRNLAIGLSRLGLQCSTRKGWQHEPIVGTGHHDQVDQAEVIVSENNIAVGTDGKALKWTILLQLDIGLQNVVLVEGFIHFCGSDVLRLD